MESVLRWAMLITSGIGMMFMAGLPITIMYAQMKQEKEKKIQKEKEIDEVLESIRGEYTELSEDGLRSTACDIIKRRKYREMIKKHIEAKIQDVKKTTTLKSALIDNIRVDYDSSGVYYGNKNDYGYLSREDYKALLDELEQVGYKCSYSYFSRGPGWDVYRNYYSELKVSW